jgi:predicted membrane protein
MLDVCLFGGGEDLGLCFDTTAALVTAFALLGILVGALALVLMLLIRLRQQVRRPEQSALLDTTLVGLLVTLVVVAFVLGLVVGASWLVWAAGAVGIALGFGILRRVVRVLSPPRPE